MKWKREVAPSLANVHSSMKCTFAAKYGRIALCYRTQRQNMRDEDNPLQSVLEYVQNVIGAIFHTSAHAISLIVADQGFGSEKGSCFTQLPMQARRCFRIWQSPMGKTLAVQSYCRFTIAALYMKCISTFSVLVKSSILYFCD